MCQGVSGPLSVIVEPKLNTTQPLGLLSMCIHFRDSCFPLSFLIHISCLDCSLLCPVIATDSYPESVQNKISIREFTPKLLIHQTKQGPTRHRPMAHPVVFRYLSYSTTLALHAIHPLIGYGGAPPSARLRHVSQG